MAGSFHLPVPATAAAQAPGWTLSAIECTVSTTKPELPDMPDFITHHIDPFTGEDDSYDMDADTGNIFSRLPPLQIGQPMIPDDVMVEELEQPISRNAPCPCGSGRKYKHCHGQLA